MLNILQILLYRSCKLMDHKSWEVINTLIIYYFIKVTWHQLHKLIHNFVSFFISCKATHQKEEGKRQKKEEMINEK